MMRNVNQSQSVISSAIINPCCAEKSLHLPTQSLQSAASLTAVLSAWFALRPASSPANRHTLILHIVINTGQCWESPSDSPATSEKPFLVMIGFLSHQYVYMHRLIRLKPEKILKCIYLKKSIYLKKVYIYIKKNLRASFERVWQI